jgi:hypothetical protein
MGKPIVAGKSVQILGKTLEMSTNLATSIAKNAIKKNNQKGHRYGNRILKEKYNGI